MPSSAELALVLKARDAASRVIGGVGGQLDKTASKAGRLGGSLATMGKLGAVGIGALAVAAIGLGPTVIGLAGKLEQMRAKAQTVFADELPLVEKWADVSAEKMGLTRAQAVGLAADFGDLLVPMGFTREQAAKMSTDVVGLSGALSRWSGGTRSAAEVADILSKAMLGERDALKGLGISITDADVDARILAKGQQDLTGTQLAQARATATQELIFEKSQDAQKAYAEGGGGLLGIQAKLDAQMAQVGETIATNLTPVLTTAMTFVTEQAIPAVAAFVGSIQRWMGENRELIDQIAALVSGVLTELFTTIGTVITWIGNLVSAIANNEDAMNVLGTIAGAIATAVDLAWNAIKTLIGWIADVVGAITKNKTIMTAFRTGWGLIAGAIQTVVDALRGVVEWAGKALDALNPFDSKTFNVGHFTGPQAPGGHASGGLAGLNGPELSWLGERGPELVIDADRTRQLLAGGGLGGQGGHSHPIILNGREVARAVDSLLFADLQPASVGVD